MHHSEQKCAYFCSEWCIVGYGTGTLWDLWTWFIWATNHYRGVSWLLKSPTTQPFVQQHVLANSNENIKVSHSWPFMRGIPWSPLDSPYKGPVTWKQSHWPIPCLCIGFVSQTTKKLYTLPITGSIVCPLPALLLVHYQLYCLPRPSALPTKNTGHENIYKWKIKT